MAIHSYIKNSALHKDVSLVPLREKNNFFCQTVLPPSWYAHPPARYTCYLFAARALSIFRSHPESPKGSLAYKITHSYRSRSRPRFFIRHFIFIILPPPPQERDRAWTKRWRLHNPPSPPAKADTDREHTSLPTAAYIPHNVFARPRLYDTANNRSWCQADILRMPRTAVRYTRKSRYIRQNKGKQSSRSSWFRLGIRRQLGKQPTAVSFAVVCVRNV